ncbi:hypothetical protein Ccrd_026749 [Cynara cardunculus var. scolymus]|uniref:DOG1 domain-containing protein n=1 Tax=Cynara cardunculus var. scolymus TaxID=59895 RepID=A0A103KH41_CYNCS|nr:hypothetical protein Ccrd_026749 [Cynara cardunculus var. scolymus]
MANEGQPIGRSFSEFFVSWEAQHKIYLDKLLTHQNDTEEDSLKYLVEQVLGHYQEYYQEKSKAAESDVFIMFSPPWFSSYERTLLWATGFKPSMAFQLVKETVGVDLNEEQKRRIAVVREETRRMERQIMRAMANVQESVAAPPFCGLVKREASLVDGEVSEMEKAVEQLKAAMVAVMKDADYLRQHTAGEVLEILSPAQKRKLESAVIAIRSAAFVVYVTKWEVRVQ